MDLDLGWQNPMSLYPLPSLATSPAQNESEPEKSLDNESGEAEFWIYPVSARRPPAQTPTRASTRLRTQTDRAPATILRRRRGECAVANNSDPPRARRIPATTRRTTDRSPRRHQLPRGRGEMGLRFKMTRWEQRQGARRQRYRTRGRGWFARWPGRPGRRAVRRRRAGLTISPVKSRCLAEMEFRSEISVNFGEFR